MDHLETRYHSHVLRLDYRQAGLLCVSHVQDVGGYARAKAENGCGHDR